MNRHLRMKSEKLLVTIGPLFARMYKVKIFIPEILYGIKRVYLS